MSDPKTTIKYDDFAKIDIRVGTVISAEKVEKSEKLIRLLVDFGELGTRQILTGLATFYKPQDFIGRQLAFVVNLETRKMMGLESQGMILGVGISDDKKPAFLLPSEETVNGEGVR